MPSVKLAAVSKVFPLTPAAGGLASDAVKVALDSVTLSIPAGTRLGIIGRNGAGKSTLLHLIAGVATPTSGSISVEGQVTSILTLGLGLREDLSGRENIYLDGEVQGRSRSDVERVMGEIVAFAELGEFIDYPVRTYSTGMKSRLMFAMISHLDPEILLIDEALSAGDHAFGSKATRRIREICGRGQIVVVVSHGLQAINEICDRCLWVDAGRILMDGPASEVTAAYEKAVFDADETELLEKLRAHIGGASYRAGYGIGKMSLRYSGESRARQVVQTGTHVTIELECDTPSSPPGTDLRLVVERLDGLVLVDETLGSALAGKKTAGCERVCVEMSPFVLGWGTYQLMVELLAEGVVVARSTSVFEVVTPNPAQGGRPAVVYPCSVSTAPA
jgi:lipopolysaccharide transport system ATP-binding protein